MDMIPPIKKSVFKIAVIGCGGIAMGCHGPAYARYAQTHPNVTLAACCDLDDQKAAQFQAQFGFAHRYSDFQEMLNREQPDAVCLNVPPPATREIGCMILEEGYPLLTEKPPGLTVEDIDALLSAAQRSGAPDMAAFNRRFMPLVVELKRRIAGQEVQAVEIVMARHHRLDPDFTTTAVHDIDLGRALLEADYSSARLSYTHWTLSDQPVTDYFLHGRLASGAFVKLSFHPATGMDIERATVYCADQTYVLACGNGMDAPGWLQVYRDNRLIEVVDGAQLAGSAENYLLNGFYAEDAAFFDALQAGERPRHDLHSARQSVAIMQAMRERVDLFKP
jgi:myo-inositol 2-dehydrogenase/D-chiro-inositol 1-dehydrogenase